MSAAPYPDDVRAKGWRFELDHERIRQSDTWALAPAELRPWLLMLWMVAWEQTPCGSLPADDNLIAARIGMPAKTLAKHRAVLLRGWWQADDGRLYHPTITARVLEMCSTRDKTSTRKKLYDQKFADVRDRDGGACVYCGSKTYLSLDHLIAVSRGGIGHERNLVTACRLCNSTKGSRTPDEAKMRFVNPRARELWEAMRDEFQAFGNATVEDHNGLERVRNAAVTRPERDGDDTGTGTSIEKERVGGHPARAHARDGDNSVDNPVGFEPTRAGLACRAIRAAGIADVNPGHPDLARLLEAGVTDEDLAETARELAGKGKARFALLLSTVEGRRRDAAEKAAVPAAPVAPWHETRSGIEAKGVELGIGAWDETAFNLGRGEHFPAYRERVFKAAGGVRAVA